METSYQFQEGTTHHFLEREREKKAETRKSQRGERDIEADNGATIPGRIEKKKIISITNLLLTGWSTNHLVVELETQPPAGRSMAVYNIARGRETAGKMC